ncbi:MAG TPA: glucosamine-6-phosphate deaminase [Methylomirabilota bacterium]|nr:glucosamine-6-phosphate deaminase [Methylomirabilota bacterium]
MLVVPVPDAAALDREAARIVAHRVREKPTITLGLPSGSTPLGMYRGLIRLHREEGLDFARVTAFNLDEYLGLAPTHPRTVHRFMREAFFDHVNVPVSQIHVPDGTAADLEASCADYERRIAEAGGIDLPVLGIGRCGHIGVNEPASSLASRTRVKTLTAATMEDTRRQFGAGEPGPECAITMGIGTILEARHILLLGAGGAKREAVARAIEGPVTATVTASALQLHPHVTALLDREAAAGLRHLDHYERVMHTTATVTPDRFARPTG